MNKARGGKEITLTGPPHNASALLPLEAAERKVSVTLQLPGGPTLYQARLKQFGAGSSEVRLRLPRETPPGSYSGEISVAGQKQRITVKVDALENVRVQPQRSTLAVPPGGTAKFTIDVVNRGNVPLEIPASARFDLTDARGQSGALGRALRAELGPDERRVDRFFEELRDRHGGEARVTVTTGSGALGAAETRTLACSIEIPGDAQPGRSYEGAWSFGNTSHVVIIEVTAAPTRTRTPE